MKLEYDKVYDNLFNSEEFVGILCKFHSSNWNKIGVNDRTELIKNFVKKYCDILKIKELKVNVVDNYIYSGTYYDEMSVISINKTQITKEVQYDVLDTLFHELRHNFQHRAITGNLTELEEIGEEKFNAFKTNFFTSPLGYSNYISSLVDSDVYNSQPVEEDAFKTGLTCAKKCYEIIREKIGDDIAFKQYCISNKSTILFYCAEDEESRKRREDAKKKVRDVYKENNKTYKKEKEYVSKIKDIVNKEITSMSIDEIMVLFSNYVWNHLDFEKKKQLLEEFSSRIDYEHKKIKIERYSITSMKINKKVVTDSNIGNILNTIFDYEYKKYIKGIIDGKCACEEKLKEQLIINFDSGDKKKSGFIKDTENFLLYSIQPYAVYEGKIIKQHFSRINEQIKRFFGCDEGEYDGWVDFYDYEKYIPYIETFYEKGFNEIQEDLLSKMNEQKNNLKRK